MPRNLMKKARGARGRSAEVRVTWDISADDDNDSRIKGEGVDDTALRVLDKVTLDDFRPVDLRRSADLKQRCSQHHGSSPLEKVDLPMEQSDICGSNDGMTAARTSSFELLQMFANANHIGRPRPCSVRARAIMHNFLPQGAERAMAAAFKPNAKEETSPHQANMTHRGDTPHGRGVGDSRGVGMG